MTDPLRVYSAHKNRDELIKLGIRCNNAEKTENKIYIDQELTQKDRNEVLTISFCGNNNSIQIHGNELPNGSISFMGDGSNAHIHRENDVNINVFLYDKSNLYIEKSFSIFGLFASIYSNTTLRIRENCLIANDVKIWTFDHHAIIDLKTMKQRNFPQDVDIGPHVWIGESSQILKGTRIEAGSIISAGAIVRGLIPSRELWGGNPARRVRRHMSWTPSHPTNTYDLNVMLASMPDDQSNWSRFKERLKKLLSRRSVPRQRP